MVCRPCSDYTSTTDTEPKAPDDSVYKLIRDQPARYDPRGLIQMHVPNKEQVCMRIHSEVPVFDIENKSVPAHELPVVLALQELWCMPT